jgi:hypothetical protein
MAKAATTTTNKIPCKITFPIAPYTFAHSIPTPHISHTAPYTPAPSSSTLPPDLDTTSPSPRNAPLSPSTDGRTLHTACTGLGLWNERKKVVLLLNWTMMGEKNLSGRRPYLNRKMVGRRTMKIEENSSFF